MEVTIEIKHVNALNKPKVTIEDGIVSYTLPFDVQLPPGTFDRITNLFRQQVPIQLTISSPQAKMDLFTEVRAESTLKVLGPAERTEQEALRENAKTALRTSERAEARANDSGDVGDREIAEGAARAAAEAITKAATALDVPENALLTTLGEEVRTAMLDEGERQADSDGTGDLAEEIETRMAAEEPEKPRRSGKASATA